MESQYPLYHTKNGTPYRAYVAEAIGLDFGESMRGKHGVIGSYVTAEEAIAAARREKNDTCHVRVINTRADEEPTEIFSL